MITNTVTNQQALGLSLSVLGQATVRRCSERYHKPSTTQSTDAGRQAECLLIRELIRNPAVQVILLTRPPEM